MNGWTLAAALLLTALVGAWLALVVRALIADAAMRRMKQVATDVLTPEQFDHLRGYLDQIDEAERERVLVRHDDELNIARLRRG